MALPSQHDNKLWLAILFEIEEAGGKIKPSDLYPRIQKYFPQITASDLALTNQIVSRQVVEIAIVWHHRIRRPAPRVEPARRRRWTASVVSSTPH